MLRELYLCALGIVVLISISHSASIKENDKTNKCLVPEFRSTAYQEGNGRCFSWFTKSQVVSQNPDDVTFHLYPNPNDANYTEQIIYENAESLQRSGYRRGQQLKIVIHGFTTDYKSEGVKNIKNAYLERQRQTGLGYNVILVDWAPLADPKAEMEGLFYSYAVDNIPIVGKRVGEFIVFLMKNGVLGSADDVHVVGFSLGAHVAGRTGQAILGLTGHLPDRVTGLDPAGPLFYGDDFLSHRHLQAGDGKFVDIIHTNLGGMGTVDVYGHVNFYPNGGGIIQKRCQDEYDLEQKLANKTPTSDTAKLDIWKLKIPELESCSHNKAPEFFAMSILNPNMVACSCNSFLQIHNGICDCTETAIFGEFCDYRTRGKFHLNI